MNINPEDISCFNCQYCLMQDFGYSNWTVEGTTITCLKEQQEEFDRWYRENPQAEFAKTCPEYAEGDPIKVDCDKDDCGHGVKKPVAETYGTTNEIKELMKKVYGER